MAKPTAQQCHALTTYYITEYTEHNKRPPVVNRNRARWGFESMLMDFTPIEVKDLLDFFIKEFSADLNWFFFNYEKVQVRRDELLEERARIRRIMQESRERSLRWREQGNQTFTEMED